MLTTLGILSSLLSIAGIIYALLNKSDYTRSLFYKRLAQDHTVSAEKINELISEEMLRGSIVFNCEPLMLTSNFIICANFLSFQKASLSASR